MKTLFILNDPPYGTERSYNAFRLAHAIGKKGEQEIKIFLLGDASACAKAGQKVPQGYYCMSTMVKAALRKGAEIGVCGTCLDARGISDDELVEGTHRSNMDQLAEWTLEADRVLVF